MRPGSHSGSRTAGARVVPGQLATWAVVLIAMVAPGASVAKPPRDRLWIRADIAAHPIREIAVLPIVNVVDDARAPAFIEERVGPHFCDQTHHLWMLPLEARKRLERETRKPYSWLDSLARQIWRSGRIDSVGARDVARQLRVQSVLCFRINRWERLDQYYPHHVRAFVGMQAALVDSAGALLWTVAGENSARTSFNQQRMLEETQVESGSGEWGVTLSNAYRRWAPDFDEALSGLLARWVKRFPVRPL